MIYPIKWSRANLQSKLFNLVKWNLVWQFIATILIPIIYLYNIFVIAGYPNTVSASLALRILGITIAAIGLFIWLISMINLRKGFGVIPQKQKRIKTGFYKYLNHPMYVGIWLTFVGLSIANASWQGLVFTNLIMTPLLFTRAYFEDKNLL